MYGKKIVWPYYYLSACSCHVMHGFQTESTLYRCLNVKELLAPSRKFLDIQVSIVCGFTLKRVHDMTRTYSQMRRTDMYSEHSSIIWPVCPNGCVLVYQLNRSGFESSSSTIYTHLQPIIVFIEDPNWLQNWRVWKKKYKHFSLVFCR